MENMNEREISLKIETNSASYCEIIRSEIGRSSFGQDSIYHSVTVCFREFA